MQCRPMFPLPPPLRFGEGAGGWGSSFATTPCPPHATRKPTRSPPRSCSCTSPAWCSALHPAHLRLRRAKLRPDTPPLRINGRRPDAVSFHQARQRACNSSARPARRPGRRPSGSSSAPGARDETPDVSGVSHFLEHMMFKGTPRRTALEVNLDFDRIGAKLQRLHQRGEHRLPRGGAARVPAAGAGHPHRHPPAQPPAGRLRHREAGDPRRDRHVRRPAGRRRPASTPGGIYYADHPLGNSVLGTQGERSRAHPRPDARLLRPPLRRDEHRSCPRPGTSTGTRSSASSSGTAAGWEPGETGRGYAARSGPGAAACTC